MRKINDTGRGSVEWEHAATRDWDWDSGLAGDNYGAATGKLVFHASSANTMEHSRWGEQRGEGNRLWLRLRLE